MGSFPTTVFACPGSLAGRFSCREQLVLQARSPDGTTHTAAVPILVNEGTPIPKGIGLNTAPLQLAPSSFAGVDLAGLSGSSAGLASALGLVDAVGPGPLADGRRIAVTGTIAPDGRVGPIAGLRYKAAAAQRAGVTLMLVPSTQVDVARRYAGKLTVVGVDSLDQAVRALGGSGCRPL